MKDGAVDAQGVSSDDFDLDSFLRENDFLKDEEQPDDKSDTKAKQSKRRSASGRSTSGKAKKARSQSKTSASSQNGAEDSAKDGDATPTNARAKSTRKSRSTTKTDSNTDAKVDLNATMSYEALGEDYPEIPLVGAADAAAEVTAGVTDTTATDIGSTDKDDTAGMAKNTDRGKVKARRTSRAKAANNTPSAASADGAASASDADSTSSTSSDSTAAAAASSAAAAATAASSTSKRRAQSSTGASSTARSTKGRSTKSSTGSLRSSATKKQTRAATTGKGGAASKQKPRLSTIAKPESFQQATFADNSYRIRGGGKRHNKRSPLMVILLAVVILAGIVLLGTSLRDVLQNLLGNNQVENPVTLTASETREAIDSEMPTLIDYLGGSAEDAGIVFTESGWNTVVSGRAAADNLDRSATSGEIIHLNSSVNPDILDQGYYEGGFDAYDYDELQQSFNGAWVLDIAQGDLGSSAQIRYVNFASDSLQDELEHLRTLEGLDENAVVDSEGTDEFDNTYIQGYSVIADTTYYWKLIGVPFADYYRGKDRRDLPPTAVFVKCTVATFDFYGAGESLSE